MVQLKDLKIKHFHAHAMADEAKKRVRIQAHASDLFPEDLTASMTIPSQLKESSKTQDDDYFQPESWALVLEECQQFDEYKAKTGSGRKAFIKRKQKPHSERALRRWKKEWLPVVTGADGKLNPTADDYSVCPRGIKLFKCKSKADEPVASGADSVQAQ